MCTLKSKRINLLLFNLFKTLNCNSSGLGYVMKNYMVPTSWTYLREMVQTLNNIRHVDNNLEFLQVS